MIFEVQTLWAARVIHLPHTSDHELAVATVFLTFFLVWLVCFSSQRAGGIQTADGLRAMHLPSQPYKGVQSESDDEKPSRYCFVFPPSNSCSHNPIPLLHPLILISNQLNSLHVFSNPRRKAVVGTVLSYGCRFMFMGLVRVRMWTLWHCFYARQEFPHLPLPAEILPNTQETKLQDPSVARTQSPIKTGRDAYIAPQFMGEEVSCGMLHMLAHRFSLSEGLWASEHT